MTRPGPGKFEGNESLEIAEALYNLINESWQNDDFGSAVDGPYWEALLLNVTPIGGHTRSYIVTEDSQGFFRYYEYATPKEAEEQYDSDIQHYTYINGERATLNE